MKPTYVTKNKVLTASQTADLLKAIGPKAAEALTRPGQRLA